MKEISFINIRENKEYSGKVKKLYKEAFLKKERMPFCLLKFLQRKGNAEFCAIHEENKFIGLIYNIFYEDIVCVYFFAIDKELRGQNYGSLVLKKLKDKYKENRIILYIQELDKNSSNYIQRQKRKEFYIKNEFYESNYSIREFGHNYEVLIYNKDNKIIEKYELLEVLRNFMGNKLFKYILENE